MCLYLLFVVFAKCDACNQSLQRVTGHEIVNQQVGLLLAQMGHGLTGQFLADTLYVAHVVEWLILLEMLENIL